MPGHDKAAGLGETPRRHEKNATSEGKADDPGNRFPGRGRLGRREQPAHEPLILRATLVEVPLTGLFFSTNDKGEYPTSRKIGVEDFCAIVHHSMGLKIDDSIVDLTGRPTHLVPAVKCPSNSSDARASARMRDPQLPPSEEPLHGESAASCDRSAWPVWVGRVGEPQPRADYSQLTPSQRIDLCWAVTKQAWSLTGQELDESAFHRDSEVLSRRRG